VGVAVDVAGAEDETGAELERVLAEADLAVSGGLGAFAGFGVIGAQEVQQVGFLQAHGAISGAPVVDQERELDAGLFAEQAGVVGVAQAYGCQACSFALEGLLVLAQLRGMLAAENSTIVPQENQDSGLRLPERAEPDLAAVGIGKGDAGQGFAERAGHRLTVDPVYRLPIERLPKNFPNVSRIFSSEAFVRSKATLHFSRRSSGAIMAGERLWENEAHLRCRAS